MQLEADKSRHTNWQPSLWAILEKIGFRHHSYFKAITKNSKDVKGTTSSRYGTSSGVERIVATKNYKSHWTTATRYHQLSPHSSAGIVLRIFLRMSSKFPYAWRRKVTKMAAWSSKVSITIHDYPRSSKNLPQLEDAAVNLKYSALSHGLSDEGHMKVWVFPRTSTLRPSTRLICDWRESIKLIIIFYTHHVPVRSYHCITSYTTVQMSCALPHAHNFPQKAALWSHYPHFKRACSEFFYRLRRQKWRCSNLWRWRSIIFISIFCLNYLVIFERNNYFGSMLPPAFVCTSLLLQRIQSKKYGGAFRF